MRLKCINASVKNYITHIEKYYLEARHHGIKFKAGKLRFSSTTTVILIPNI